MLSIIDVDDQFNTDAKLFTMSFYPSDVFLIASVILQSSYQEIFSQMHPNIVKYAKELWQIEACDWNDHYIILSLEISESFDIGTQLLNNNDSVEIRDKIK